MPLFVKDYAKIQGYTCHVTMIAHGGWFLAQHVNEPDVRFNLLFGDYDYVVLQEHTHPFAEEEKYHTAVLSLCAWAKKSNTIPVIYQTWAQNNEPQKQAYMNTLQRNVGEEASALIAPVGENWWQYKSAHPDINMYAEDGAHASKQGSEFAAKIIWDTIFQNMQ